MLEGKLAKKVLSEAQSLDGYITTGRNFQYYEDLLGVRPEALNNSTVLNFGSGSSNLNKDLKRKGINCNLIDVDLRHDPSKNASSLNPLRIVISTIDLIDDLIPNGKTRDKLVELKRSLADTKGRKIAQGDGKSLPFLDKTFDYVLALWSTYQLPPEARESAYRELFRVGEILHIGPIFGNDYRIITRLTEELGYEIVLSQPFRPFQPFEFKSKKDYESYISNYNYSFRTSKPELDEPITVNTFGKKGASSEGGNIIILKRKPGAIRYSTPALDNS